MRRPLWTPFQPLRFKWLPFFNPRVSRVSRERVPFGRWSLSHMEVKKKSPPKKTCCWLSGTGTSRKCSALRVMDNVSGDPLQCICVVHREVKLACETWAAPQFQAGLGHLHATPTCTLHPGGWLGLRGETALPETLSLFGLVCMSTESYLTAVCVCVCVCQPIAENTA
jgi:hypothetical protein